MCQSVFRNRRDTTVTFSLINRTKSIRLAELVDEGELREQLDHIRSLSLSRGESTWLRGNTFYGKRQMFRSDFMEWFENLTLPPYQLEKRDGQYELTFEGSWPEVMLWEIPALAVLMELRARAVLKDLGKFELQVLYARAMTRTWQKVERLRDIPGLRLADFGTRRRHSFLWQDWCVQAMVYAALANSDAELSAAPYRVLADWHEEHEGNLRIILPDTYGTEQFLKNAPDWLAGWTGIRIDSGDPAEGAETAIRWWKSRGEDPREKLVIFSDGLEVEKIVELHAQFADRVRVSFGWGTMLTNDFRGLVPGDRLQGGQRRRTPHRQAVGQPEKGDGTGRRDRALQARFRRGRTGSPGRGGLNRMPRLIRLYIRECLLGFALAIVFSMALVILNVGNLGHLVGAVEGGWLAFVMLCAFNGIVFAGVQVGITVMRMASDDD